ALVDGRDRLVDVGIGCRQQAHDMRIFFLRLAEQQHAVAAGHSLIGDQYRHAIAIARQGGSRFGVIVRRSDIQFASKSALEILAYQRLIIDEQYNGVADRQAHCGYASASSEHTLPGLGGLSARSKLNSVHSPSLLATCSSPP